jgi:hypothetical protein
MLGLTAGAYYIVGNRQSESVGRASSAAHAVLSSALLFLNCGLFIIGAHESESSAVFPIIVSMLSLTAFVYFVAELITLSGKANRLKNMGRSAIRYVITVLAAGLVFTLVPAFDAFGAGNTLPNRTEVESVELYAPQVYYGNGYESFVMPELPGANNTFLTFSTTLYPLKATFSQAENIDALYNLHKSYVDTRKDNYGGTLILRYNLKGGGEFTRQIRLPNREAAEELTKLQLTEEYLNYRFDSFESTYLYGSNPITWAGVYVNAAGAQGQIKEGTEGWYSSESGAGKEMYEAYKADRLEHRSFDEIYGSAVIEGYVWVDAVQNVGHDNVFGEVLQTSHHLRLEVLSSYERVHAVMAKYNLRFPAWSEYAAPAIELKDNETGNMASVSLEQLTDPADTAFFQKIEGNLHLSRPDERYVIQGETSLGLPDSVTEQEIAEMFARMREQYEQWMKSEISVRAENAAVYYY